MRLLSNIRIATKLAIMSIVGVLLMQAAPATAVSSEPDWKEF